MTWSKPKETGLERRRRSGAVADAIAAPRRGGAWKRRRGLGETPQGPPGNAAGTCDLSGGQLPMAGPLITLQRRQSKPRRVAAGIHPAPVPPGGSFEDSQWQMAVHITTILALNFNPPRQNNLLPSLPDTHLRGHRRRGKHGRQRGPQTPKESRVSAPIDKCKRHSSQTTTTPPKATPRSHCRSDQRHLECIACIPLHQCPLRAHLFPAR